MATLVSDALGLGTGASHEQTSPIPLEFMVVSRRASRSARVNQEETAPFPLEFEVVSRRASRSARVNQEETAPFLLEFEVVARRGRVNQEETAPFPLEFRVVLPDGEVMIARAAHLPRGRGRTPPGLKWRGMNASIELREYAARVASGEDLPPFRGPILASGAFPGFAPGASGMESAGGEPSRERVGQVPAVAKLVLGLILMAAAVVASAVLGDDAELRAAGQSISRWLTGQGSSY